MRGALGRGPTSADAGRDHGGPGGTRWYTRRDPDQLAEGRQNVPGSAPSTLTVAVVGATGAVGRTMTQVLLEKRFPMTALRLLASERSAGKTVAVPDWGDITVELATPDSFEGIDIALFSAGGGTSKELAPEAAKRGCTVVDNSSAWRMDPAIPLVVSQVNPDDLAWHEGIIANPNCSTMQLMPPMMALRDAVGIERMVVDTYQAVSGTGHKAIVELEDQVKAHAEGRPKVANVYPYNIGFNALPHIDAFMENGYTKEEWKVVTESRKILHLPDLRVSCTAVRVPVFMSHSEAVHVETRAPITPDEARALFAGVPGVVVQDDPANKVYPLAEQAAGSDLVFVGRVRQDPSIPDGKGLAFWVVSDNLRKGAASNAVEIAEVLVARGWIAAASRRGAAAGTTAGGRSGA
jgi:aspartate-semialdehyde dehydrogenase